LVVAWPRYFDGAWQGDHWWHCCWVAACGVVVRGWGCNAHMSRWGQFLGNQKGAYTAWEAVQPCCIQCTASVQHCCSE
jgi:hypothetical protein